MPRIVRIRAVSAGSAPTCCKGWRLHMSNVETAAVFSTAIGGGLLAIAGRLSPGVFHLLSPGVTRDGFRAMCPEDYARLQGEVACGSRCLLWRTDAPDALASRAVLRIIPSKRGGRLKRGKQECI